MNVGIIADTHMPQQARRLPSEFRERIAAADHVLHAGDFSTQNALTAIERIGPELTAVYGNTDPEEIDLPVVASVDIGNVTFVLTHGNVNPVERAAGRSEGGVYDREDWLDAIAEVTRARATEPMVGVGGHIHTTVDTNHKGVRILNPGTATGATGVEKTMMTAEVSDSDLSVTIHEI